MVRWFTLGVSHELVHGMPPFLRVSIKHLANLTERMWKMEWQEFHLFVHENKGKSLTIDQIQQQRRENRLPEINVLKFLALIKQSSAIVRTYKRIGEQTISIFEIR